MSSINVQTSELCHGNHWNEHAVINEYKEHAVLLSVIIPSRGKCRRMFQTQTAIEMLLTTVDPPYDVCILALITLISMVTCNDVKIVNEN